MSGYDRTEVCACCGSEGDDLEDVAVLPGPPSWWCPDCSAKSATECGHCAQRVSKKHLHSGRTFSLACWQCARNLRKEEKAGT